MTEAQFKDFIVKLWKLQKKYRSHGAHKKADRWFTITMAFKEDFNNQFKQ